MERTQTTNEARNRRTLSPLLLVALFEALLEMSHEQHDAPMENNGRKGEEGVVQRKNWIVGYKHGLNLMKHEKLNDYYIQNHQMKLNNLSFFFIYLFINNFFFFFFFFFLKKKKTFQKIKIKF